MPMHKEDAAVHHCQRVLCLLLALVLILARLTRVVLHELGLQTVDTMRIRNSQAMATSYMDTLKHRICTSSQFGEGNLTLGITIRGTKSHCSTRNYHNAMAHRRITSNEVLYNQSKYECK
jgi:hypothetical protein